MTESDRGPQDSYVEWIAREAKRPVALSGGLQGRIMDAVRATALPARPRRPLGWLTAPRPSARSPLVSSLLAAGLVGIGVLTGIAVTHQRNIAAPNSPASASDVASAARVVTHEFVLQAPHATKVALVGDFNGWSGTATPMTRTDDGKWVAKVRLPAGRHVYAFEVDDAGGTTKFMPDPAGLRAPDDGFGPSSVVLVGQGSAI